MVFLKSLSKKTLALACLLTVVGASNSVFADSAKEAAALVPIKIGQVVSLTGAYEKYGAVEKNAAQMAVDEINKNGGVKGHPLQIVFMDSESNNDAGVKASITLLDKEKVVVLLAANTSDIAVATAPIADYAQVPQIAPSASNRYVSVAPSGKVRPYSFKLSQPDTYLGEKVAEFVADKLKAKKAAFIFNVNSIYEQSITRAFNEKFQNNGGKIVAREFYYADSVDFKDQIKTITDKKPEVLFVSGLGKEVVTILAEAQKAGLLKNTKIVGADTDPTGLVDGALPETFKDSYWLLLPPYTNEELDVEQAKGVMKKYVDNYGKPVAPGNILRIYDVVYWIKDAIERADKLEGASIAKALSETKDLHAGTMMINVDAKTNTPEPQEVQKEARVVYVDKDLQVIWEHK